MCCFASANRATTTAGGLEEEEEDRVGALGRTPALPLVPEPRLGPAVTRRRARRPQASARPCGHRPRGKVATEDPNTAFSKCRRHSALRVLRFSANLQTPSRWILDPAPPAIPSVPKPRAAQRDYTQPARGGTHLGRAADADLDAETPPRKMRLRPARPRAGGAKGPSRSARPRPGPEGSHVPVRKPRNGQGVKRSRSRPPKGTPSATPHPRPASRPPSPRP
ncbi:nascent polypeptide-associated complex subunit alpha, muscle-specific form-like [Heterocephalus glaber]|uniref:Nascent polypeptide-associated complex subunit alpha, muscle-specific form-like n=1 Tax=Heterocephalus glaber TaxID=10181 RepID=A0AAX6QNP5_HETGA|nr:nascent polypeptide-associated complex subunit alpha, muscle-specific form-like [Heterocephalus glaber]